MKMKKMLPLLLAAVIATGCTSDGVTSVPQTDTRDTTANNTTSADTQENTLPDEDRTVLLTGTWELYSVSEDDTRIQIGYGFTGDDGMSGEIVLFEDKTTFQFGYMIGINEIDVSIGSEMYTFPIAGGDQSFLMLDIPDIGRIDMAYMSDVTREDIPEFYSNEELGQMAQQYYTALYDYTPSCVGTRMNPDNTVTIQLYDNMGDHNSTSAWYTVDRWSTEGTDDISGDAVNFLHVLIQE